MKTCQSKEQRAEGRRLATANAWLVLIPVMLVSADALLLTRRNAAEANHASGATYSVADNRIVSVGTAELRRQRISHASIGRGVIDAVARVVELVRGSRLGAARAAMYAFV